jgi:hypothetical protein
MTFLRIVIPLYLFDFPDHALGSRARSRRCSQFLGRGPTTVDRQIGAGDLGGIVAAQEQR